MILRIHPLSARRVAPITGAWIEIGDACTAYVTDQVAPFMGAWIEISALDSRRILMSTSLPSRERGLK